MRTRTILLAISLAVSAQAAKAEELGSSVSSSDAVYSQDLGSRFGLTAVQGSINSGSLLVSNHTEQPIVIRDMNGGLITVIKSGRTLDFGSRLDELPEFVVITASDDVGGHYVRLSEGLVITAKARKEVE